MGTPSVACRVSVMALIITVSVMRMLVPAFAAGEGNAGEFRQRHLTINGRPLSRLLDATIATSGGVDRHLWSTRTTRSWRRVLITCA